MYRLPSKKTYTIVFLIVFFFISISFYSNIEFYKKYFIDKIYTTIDFKIEFQESSLSFFPLPGIILHHVKIDRSQGNSEVVANFTKVEFLFSWKILFGEIKLVEVHTIEGQIEFTSNKKIESKTQSQNQKSIDTTNLQKVFTFLNIDTITFSAIQFIYKKQMNLKEELYINSLKINNNHINEVFLDFDLKYQDGNFNSYNKIQYTNNNHSFDSLEIESKLEFKNFALKPFKEYYSLVNGANFDNTILNGKVTVFKEKFKNQYNIKTDIDIINLYFIGAPIYPLISVSSEFTLLPESKQINFINIYANYQNGAIGSANGILTFTNDIYLNLNIRGEYADIYKVIYLIVRSVDLKMTSNSNFYSHMNIFCSRAYFDLFELRTVRLYLDIKNTLVEINTENADVLQGHISGNGALVASKNTTYNYNIKLQEINSEQFISKYTKNPYLKGYLSSNLSFSSSGNSLNLFLDNLKSSGKIQIKDGELLGYANILKPIFSLGKLVNVLGPRGKNTDFQSLLLDFNLQNRRVTVQNLKMVGVGLDAHGGGNIGFDRKIDFRIYVGLGGLAGKALYIPILYKGIMPDNVSYIDPVWIGSVYVGATLFGGPAGATVGGVAGSAVTEYLYKAWEGVKGIFSSE